MNNIKRKRILETAMKLFNSFGFDATPTSKIASKARVSVGTLFNYFPTKVELIQAIYVEVKIHSRQTFLENARPINSKKDNLLSMWRTVIHWGINNPEEFNYLEMFSSSPYINNFKNEDTLETYQQFRQSILETISEQDMTTYFAEYLLRHIDSALHAAIRTIISTQDIHHLDAFLNQSFDLVWFGLSKTDKSLQD